MKSLNDVRRGRILRKLTKVRSDYQKAHVYAMGLDPIFWPQEHALATQNALRLFEKYRALNLKLKTLGG